jgi:hypothetical protein
MMSICQRREVSCVMGSLIGISQDGIPKE